MNRPRIALLMLMVIYTSLLMAVGYADDETDLPGLELRGASAAYDPEQALLYYGPLDEPTLSVDAYEDPYLNEAYGLPSRNDLWVGAELETAEGTGEATPLEPAASLPLADPTQEDELPSAPAPVANTEPYDLDELFYAEQQPTLAPPKPQSAPVVSVPVDIEDDYAAEFGDYTTHDNGCPLLSDVVERVVRDSNRCLRSYFEQAEQHFVKTYGEEAPTIFDHGNPALGRKGKYRDIAAVEPVDHAADELDCDKYLTYIHDEFGWYDIPRSPTLTPTMTATVIMKAAPLVAVREHELYDDEWQWDCHAPVQVVRQQPCYDPQMATLLDPDVNWSRLWWPEVSAPTVASASTQDLDLIDEFDFRDAGLPQLTESETVSLVVTKLGEWLGTAAEALDTWRVPYPESSPASGVADATFDELLDITSRSRGEVNFDEDEF